MKCLDIKTGSILIYKKYGLLKCWWNKLMRKELPFNKYKQNYQFLRRQLNTDPEEGSKINMGTQMVKIVL